MRNQLTRRDCDIKMKIVPYGAGWTDVYLNIGEDNLYFIISAMDGGTFTDLLRILYFLHPENDDPEREENFIDCWEGLVKHGEVVKIAERIADYTDLLSIGLRLYCTKENSRCQNYCPSA